MCTKTQVLKTKSSLHTTKISSFKYIFIVFFDVKIYIKIYLPSWLPTAWRTLAMWWNLTICWPWPRPWPTPGGQWPLTWSGQFIGGFSDQNRICMIGNYTWNNVEYNSIILLIKTNKNCYENYLGFKKSFLNWGNIILLRIKYQYDHFKFEVF